MILFHQRFYARWSFKEIHFHFLVVALGEVNQETSVMSSNYWVLSLFPTLKKIGKHNIQKSKYNFLKERHFVFRGFDKGELADYDDITLFYKALTMKWYDILIFWAPLSSVALLVLDWFLSFSHVTIKIHYQRW